MGLIFFFFRVSFTQHLLRLCSFSTVSSFDLLHLLLLLLHLCRRRLFVVVFVYPIFLPWAYLWFGKTKQNINKFEKKIHRPQEFFFQEASFPKDSHFTKTLSLSLSLSLSLQGTSCTRSLFLSRKQNTLSPLSETKTLSDTLLSSFSSFFVLLFAFA